MCFETPVSNLGGWYQVVFYCLISICHFYFSSSSFKEINIIIMSDSIKRCNLYEVYTDRLLCTVTSKGNICASRFPKIQSDVFVISKTWNKVLWVWTKFVCTAWVFVTYRRKIEVQTFTRKFINKTCSSYIMSYRMSQSLFLSHSHWTGRPLMHN